MYYSCYLKERDMSKKYKVCFEGVVPIGIGAKYYDEYQRRPICSPEEVEDEDWAKTENFTDDPWDQYKTLRDWEKSGEHLIRNVRLYEVSETLTEITDNNLTQPDPKINNVDTIQSK